MTTEELVGIAHLYNAVFTLSVTTWWMVKSIWRASKRRRT